MRALAGAVLILAASVLLGAGTIARAMVEAANRPSNADGPVHFAAVVVGLLGVLLLFVGLAVDAVKSRGD